MLQDFRGLEWDMEAHSLCQYLDWDSDFFGRRIARITVNQLSREDVECVILWCNSHAIDCLYFLANSDHADTVRVAEDNKFHFVDIRVTLEKQLGDIPVVNDRVFSGSIRLCKPSDVPALRAIARVSHRDSRFYYDGNFPESLCNALYETWIEKSCGGYADAVLVAELRGQPVGYVSCHLTDLAKGRIGLVGAGKDFRGEGLGRVLVTKSLRWFAEHGARQVTVVTQGRNWRAQRLYQRCGFVTQSVQLWYHRWFAPMRVPE